jgi:hypothetical protein
MPECLLHLPAGAQKARELNTPCRFAAIHPLSIAEFHGSQDFQIISRIPYARAPYKIERREHVHENAHWHCLCSPFHCYEKWHVA